MCGATRPLSSTRWSRSPLDPIKVAVIHGDPEGESERWLQGQINRITAERGP
jgi:hypothetical protein